MARRSSNLREINLLHKLKRAIKRKASSSPQRKAASRKPQQLIDLPMFPHLAEAIVASASREALLALRGVCRELKRQCDARLAHHIVLRGVGPDDAEVELFDYQPIELVSADGGGRLPMFGDWSIELQPDMPAAIISYAEVSGADVRPRSPYSKELVYRPTPRVLYPGVLHEAEMYNKYVRARIACDTLRTFTKVVDIVGPLPLGRLREIFSGLNPLNGRGEAPLRHVIRFRPDGIGELSPFAVGAESYPNDELLDLVEGTHWCPSTWNPISFKADTVVHFMNIAYADNVDILSEMRTAGFQFLKFYARKLVLHFIIRPEQVERMYGFRHRLGYDLQGVDEVVIIFQRRPGAPTRLTRSPTLHEPLRRLFRDVITPNTRISFVNIGDLYPELVGMPPETSPDDVVARFPAYFAKQKRSANKNPVAGKCRLFTLDEYRTHVSAEQFELETVAWHTTSDDNPLMPSNAVPPLIPLPPLFADVVYPDFVDDDMTDDSDFSDNDMDLGDLQDIGSVMFGDFFGTHDMHSSDFVDEPPAGGWPDDWPELS